MRKNGKLIYKHFKDKIWTKIKTSNKDWKNRWNKNYLLEEIKLNDLMSKKHKRISKTLNYIEHILILTSAFTGCVLISAFTFVVGTSLGITVGL